MGSAQLSSGAAPGKPVRAVIAGHVHPAMMYASLINAAPAAGRTVGALDPGGYASRMHAYVYKSLKKADAYVFLAAADDFARLPQPWCTQLSPLQLVLQTELTPRRKLARGDAAVVRENLARCGFHIQFPPFASHDPMTEDRGTDA